MQSKHPYVILGSGPAGVSAAEAIGELDGSGVEQGHASLARTIH